MKQLILTLTLILATNFVFAETNEKEIKSIELTSTYKLVGCSSTTVTTTQNNIDGSSTTTSTTTVTCDTTDELADYIKAAKEYELFD